MSSLDALSIAANSLLVTQQQLAVVSQNIGNSQNSNYNARTAETQSIGADGNSVSVTVTRAVNQILQNEMLAQTTASGGATVTNQVYQQLEALTGGNTTSPALASAMEQVLNAFQGYQSAPESVAAQNGVISAAQNLATQIQSISSGLATIQNQTQSTVTSDVTTLNNALTQLNQINGSIVAYSAAGQSTAGLEDQRDQLIAQVATYLPVRQQQNSDGSVYLYTPGGVALVDGSATQFAYQPPGTYTPSYSATGASTPTPNNSTSGGIIYNAADPSQTALNTAFSGGKIGAEINMLRTDTAAVNSSDPTMAPIAKAQQQLAYLTEQLYDPNAGQVGSSFYGTAFQQVFGGVGSASNDAAGAASNIANSLFTSTTGTAATPGTLQVNPALVGTSSLPSVLTQQNAANVVNFLSTGTATVTDGANNTQTTVTYSFPGNNGSPAVPGTITGQAISLAGLPQAFAADESGRAAQAQDASQTATTNLATTTTSYKGQTGVSIDQQLELMVVLQNSYNAASKVISTINQLQQQLFNAA
jgi:flagellar hook-associated protein 1 FlgK